jgi:glutamate synthase domain-containing protein 2
LIFRRLWAGGKPGSATHLPGGKVEEDISKMRMISKGAPACLWAGTPSPLPFYDGIIALKSK